jgi:hypothetical protein
VRGPKNAASRILSGGKTVRDVMEAAAAYAPAHGGRLELSVAVGPGRRGKRATQAFLTARIPPTDEGSFLGGSLSVSAVGGRVVVVEHAIYNHDAPEVVRVFPDGFEFLSFLRGASSVILTERDLDVGRVAFETAATKCVERETDLFLVGECIGACGRGNFNRAKKRAEEELREALGAALVAAGH